MNDQQTRAEIKRIVTMGRISREDIQADLQARQDGDPSGRLMSLAQFGADQLRGYLDAAD